MTGPRRPGAGRVTPSGQDRIRRQQRPSLEVDLERWLQKWLHDLDHAMPGRLLAYHTRRSTGSNPGFPDWVFAGPGGLAFRELKRPGGKLSAEQEHWFAMLRAAGHDVDVWREVDRHSGRISAELRRIAGLGIAAHDRLGQKGSDG